MYSEEKSPSIEMLPRTIDVCAWLIDIAQYFARYRGLPSVIVNYLDAFGSDVNGEPVNGGMGVVTPMKRSATAIEMLVHMVANRGAQLLNGSVCLARLDKQISVCGELMQ